MKRSNRNQHAIWLFPPSESGESEAARSVSGGGASGDTGGGERPAGRPRRRRRRRPASVAQSTAAGIGRVTTRGGRGLVGAAWPAELTIGDTLVTCGGTWRYVVGRTDTWRRPDTESGPPAVEHVARGSGWWSCCTFDVTRAGEDSTCCCCDT